MRELIDSLHQLSRAPGVQCASAQLVDPNHFSSFDDPLPLSGPWRILNRSMQELDSPSPNRSDAA